MQNSGRTPMKRWRKDTHPLAFNEINVYIFKFISTPNLADRNQKTKNLTSQEQRPLVPALPSFSIAGAGEDSTPIFKPTSTQETRQSGVQITPLELPGIRCLGTWTWHLDFLKRRASWVTGKQTGYPNSLGREKGPEDPRGRGVPKKNGESVRGLPMEIRLCLQPF